MSGAGTAANAFDANNATLCSATTDGWIGYDFTAATIVRVVGIRSNGTRTLSLEFSTDDNDTFTSATAVGTKTVVVTDDVWTFFDVPLHTGETRFRIRETGGADLDIRDLVFSKGLVINVTVDDTLDNTNADAAWTEENWGSHHGYPRTVAFAGNRLGTLYQKKYCSHMDPRTGAVIQFIVATALITPLALIFEGGVIHWTPALIASLAYVALFLSLISMILLTVMIRRGEASRMTSLFFLIPPMAALLAYLILDEPVGLMTLAGMAVAVVGVALVMAPTTQPKTQK